MTRTSFRRLSVGSGRFSSRFEVAPNLREGGCKWRQPSVRAPPRGPPRLTWRHGAPLRSPEWLAPWRVGLPVRCQQAPSSPPKNNCCSRAFIPQTGNLPTKHGHFPMKHKRSPLKRGQSQLKTRALSNQPRALPNQTRALYNQPRALRILTRALPD